VHQHHNRNWRRTRRQHQPATQHFTVAGESGVGYFQSDLLARLAVDFDAACLARRKSDGGWIFAAGPSTEAAPHVVAAVHERARAAVYPVPAQLPRSRCQIDIEDMIIGERVGANVTGARRWLSADGAACEQRQRKQRRLFKPT